MSATPRADLWFSICLVAFGIAALVESWRMPRLTELGIDPLSAPGLTPGILAAVITLLGAVVLLRSLRTAGAPGAVAEAGWGRLAAALALCLVYALGLVGRMDFTLATGLYVFAFTALFTPDTRPWFRRLAAAAVLAAVAAVAVTLLFERVFLVRLP